MFRQKRYIISLFLLLWSGFGQAADYSLSPSGKLLFECKNEIGIETYSWDKSLVTYAVRFTGNIRENNLILLNKQTGRPEVFQLSNVRKASEILLSADISFMAKLPFGGEFQYELSVDKANKHSSNVMIPIGESAGIMELNGAKMQIRTPQSREVNGHESLAPVISINQNGAWAGENKILSPKRKILSLQAETLEAGSLFVERQFVYRFENDGIYRVKVKLIKDTPFVILDESMENLSANDSIVMEMAWTGFHPTKRYAMHWDQSTVGRQQGEVWLGIDRPVYIAYCKEDPHWTGMGWMEKPAERMMYRLCPFGGNSVREQPPVMSFWEETGANRELGVFVYDANRWDDKQYGIWQPTTLLSVYFRYNSGRLYFTYPLASGSRSTAISFFAEKEGLRATDERKAQLAAIRDRGGKYQPEQLFFRYSQLLMMQQAWLSLDKIKDWQLAYPENGKRPDNPFPARANVTAEEFIKQLSVSPIVYYPMCLNGYPGVHSIEHRILFANHIEDYLRFYKDLTPAQRKSVEALFLLSGYVNTLENMNAIRNSLAGTANMAADGWSIPPQVAFIMPEHPMANEWMDFFEKTLEIYGLFYTRPDVNTYESAGGRWVESLGIYNWAFLRPTTFSNMASEYYDGKNRFASPYMEARAQWMLNMLTSPVDDSGRKFPPHGAHGGGYLVPRYLSMYQLAEWLKNYNPLLAEHLFWAGTDGDDVEKKPTDSDWAALFRKRHPETSTGTNPHLKSAKYTGHGIILRAGVDTDEELSIHLNQVDKGPNYRFGNQGEGNTGGLYFYAKGNVYTAHENEIAGDHIVNNLDGVTNFGAMKDGDYRTIGMNELKAPLYDFGFAQYAELLSDTGKYKYVYPEYASRSVMLAGTDYFILYDEVGTGWRSAERFAWFNANGKDFPQITFLSPPARTDHWMTAQTPHTHGFYRDNFGSVLTLITHKKGEVFAEGGKPVAILLLNDANVMDFQLDKNNDLPEGAVKIRTAHSRDIIFRNSQRIQYQDDNESFSGQAGLIRRFGSGRLEMTLFKGEHIGADGLSVSISTSGKAAIALARTNGEIQGLLKTGQTVTLKLTGLVGGGKLYANGTAVRTQGIDTLVAVFPQGVHRLEYTAGKPIPEASRILYSEYEKNRVKLYIDRPAGCESVRMEISTDNGKTWKPAGYASGNNFYLPKGNSGKVHVRAVSVNGEKQAVSAEEYPVYFTNEKPHYPEGLWLKLGKNQVQLSWGEVLGVQKYRLYRRKQGEGRFQLLYEGRERSFTDTKAAGVQPPYRFPGTEDNRHTVSDESLIIYEYAVSAVNGNGEGAASLVENTDPASWRNWYPNTELKFNRQSAFWMPPYVYPDMTPEKYYPE